MEIVLILTLSLLGITGGIYFGEKIYNSFKRCRKCKSRGTLYKYEKYIICSNCGFAMNKTYF